MKRYCLALDLKNDSSLIEEYINWHKNIWPEVVKNMKEVGIADMQIYLYGNRLFMIMETDSSFSFEKKEAIDSNNPKVQEWEELMWKYQQAMPGAKPGEKWMLMENIFSLSDFL